MSTFRPDVQHQGPATHCIINGKAVGWLSCTAYGVAMGIDKSTLSRKQPSGCAVRRPTGDTTGGLTLNQVAVVAQGMGVHIELHVGSNITSPREVGAALKKGRGVAVQGNTGPLVNTRYKNTGGAINHLVWVNEGRGFGSDNIPDEVLVYDPAADHRRPDIDDSPSWWPWWLLIKFAGALHPWGEGDPRTLGSGRLYAGFFPDTEPHVVLRFGAIKTKPFPDRTRAAGPKGHRVNVHSAPRKTAETVVDTLTNGELFVAYQRVAGDEFRGSRMWYGDQEGRHWVHSKRLAHEGGST